MEELKMRKSFRHSSKKHFLINYDLKKASSKEKAGSRISGGHAIWKGGGGQQHLEKSAFRHSEKLNI